MLPEAVVRFVDERLQLFLVADVARDRGGTTFARLRALIAAHASSHCSILRLEIDDARTVIRERVRHRQTHAFRCTGEHRDAIVQIEETHGSPCWNCYLLR